MSNAYDYQEDPELSGQFVTMGEGAAVDRYNDEPTARIVVRPPSVLRLPEQEDTRMSDALVRMGAIGEEPDRVIAPESYKSAPAWATGLVEGARDYIKRPGQMMERNPYPEGTEEWYEIERRKSQAETDFAGETALNTTGTGAVVGVPMRAGETVLGAGAVRRATDVGAGSTGKARPRMGKVAEIDPTIGYELPTEIPKSHPVRQYVDEPQRVLKPGVYKRPDVLAREAEARVAPEHPAMKELFGVTRQDLYDISQAGTREGNVAPNIWQPAKPKGSYAAENVTNPANAQRLVDTIAETRRLAPELTRGMVPWYVMDPAFHHLVKLVGPERAVEEYRKFNEYMTPFSASSDVLKEINRGTGARMMAERGEFDKFKRFGGVAEENRGSGFPPELAGITSHPYHGIHTSPIEKYIATGSHGYGNDTVKIPLYTQASGVPETGFQTQWAVPDAHFTRASGMSDVRKNASPGDYMGGSEYRSFAPWFREQVAKPSGIEAVPAQAVMWGAYAPQTGVKTAIGAPKLELISQRIWERAKELGIDPRKLRDDVLLGKSHATWLLGGAVGGAGAAKMGSIAAQDGYEDGL